jgi:hypothetical protein
MLSLGRVRSLARCGLSNTTKRVWEPVRRSRDLEEWVVKWREVVSATADGLAATIIEKP